MRGAPVLALLLLLTPWPHVHAQAATPPLELVATERDGRSVFLDAGGAEHPTLQAIPGSHVVIRFANQGALRHGLVVGAPVSRGTACCLGPGESTTLDFDLPAGFEGLVELACPLHGDAGMRATLRVGPPPIEVRLVAPANGTTVHGDVDATVRLVNATLGQGVTLRWILDGRLVAHDANASLPLRNLTRTNHLLQVEAVNGTDAVLARAESFFYVQDAVETPTTPSEGGATPASSTPASEPARTPGAGLAWVVLAAALVALTRSRAR